jgi:2-keto-4-pentenoate hydratase
MDHPGEIASTPVQEISIDESRFGGSQRGGQVDALRDDKLRQAAEILLTARRQRTPILNLPEGLRPVTLAEAYHLQDIVAEAIGPVGGWKVGAPSPNAEPLCAPMPLRGGFATANSVIRSSYSRLRGVEAEIAFLLGRDLPAREAAYSRDEVVAAIASAHPAIELLESAFEEPDHADRLSVIGDLQSNGGFAYGEAYPGWQAVDLARETATVIIDGVVRVEATGSNSAGNDLLRLVVWMANAGQVRTGGLKAGDWITTGSWTGRNLAVAASEVLMRFSSFGEVRISFAG